MDAGTRIVELEEARMLPGGSSEPERRRARLTLDRPRRSERRDRTLPGLLLGPGRRRDGPRSLASRSPGRLSRRAAAFGLSTGALRRGCRLRSRRSGPELERADIARSDTRSMTLVGRRAGRRLACVDGGTTRLESGSHGRPSVERDQPEPGIIRDVRPAAAVSVDAVRARRHAGEAIPRIPGSVAVLGDDR